MSEGGGGCAAVRAVVRRVLEPTKAVPALMLPASSSRGRGDASSPGAGPGPGAEGRPAPHEELSSFAMKAS